jgi:hypothetical protein
VLASLPKYKESQNFELGSSPQDRQDRQLFSDSLEPSALNADGWSLLPGGAAREVTWARAPACGRFSSPSCCGADPTSIRACMGAPADHGT